MKSIKIKLVDIVCMGIGLGLLLYVVSKGYQLFLDSNSYISNNIGRTPLYPLLLDIFQSAFGRNYLHFVPIFQSLFVFLSSLYLANILEKELRVGQWIKYLIFLILLFPQLKFVSSILTESITYSLFLLAIAFWIKHISKKRDRDIYLSILFVLLSILARPQLYFVLPVLFLYLLFFVRLKKGLLLILILIGGIFANDTLQKTYNYIYHGRYILPPFGNFTFITTQLYLSDTEDINLFSDQKEREFFEKVYSAMDEGKMLHKYGWEMHGGLESSHFLTFYNKILWSTIFPILNETYKDKGKSEVDRLIELNKFCGKISKRLFMDNYKKFLKFSIRSIYEIIGLFSILIISLLFTGIWGVLKKKNSLFVFFMIIALLELSNYCLLLISQPLWMMRYRFYTDIMVVVAFVVLSCRMVQGEKNG